VTDRVEDFARRALVDVFVALSVRVDNLQSAGGPAPCQQPIELLFDALAGSLAASPFKQIEMTGLGSARLWGHARLHPFEVFAAAFKMTPIAGAVPHAALVIAAPLTGVLPFNVEWGTCQECGKSLRASYSGLQRFKEGWIGAADFPLSSVELVRSGLALVECEALINASAMWPLPDGSAHFVPIALFYI